MNFKKIIILILFLLNCLRLEALAPRTQTQLSQTSVDWSWTCVARTLEQTRWRVESYCPAIARAQEGSRHQQVLTLAHLATLAANTVRDFDRRYAEDVGQYFFSPKQGAVWYPRLKQLVGERITLELQAALNQSTPLEEQAEQLNRALWQSLAPWLIGIDQIVLLEDRLGQVLPPAWRGFEIAGFPGAAWVRAAILFAAHDILFDQVANRSGLTSAVWEEVAQVMVPSGIEENIPDHWIEPALSKGVLGYLNRRVRAVELSERDHRSRSSLNTAIRDPRPEGPAPIAEVVALPGSTLEQITQARFGSASIRIQEQLDLLSSRPERDSLTRNGALFICIIEGVLTAREEEEGVQDDSKDFSEQAKNHVWVILHRDYPLEQVMQLTIHYLLDAPLVERRPPATAEEINLSAREERRRGLLPRPRERFVPQFPREDWNNNALQTALGEILLGFIAEHAEEYDRFGGSFQEFFFNGLIVACRTIGARLLGKDIALVFFSEETRQKVQRYLASLDWVRLEELVGQREVLSRRAWMQSLWRVNQFKELSRWLTNQVEARVPRPPQEQRTRPMVRSRELRWRVVRNPSALLAERARIDAEQSRRMLAQYEQLREMFQLPTPTSGRRTHFLMPGWNTTGFESGESWAQPDRAQMQAIQSRLAEDEALHELVPFSIRIEVSQNEGVEEALSNQWVLGEEETLVITVKPSLRVIAEKDPRVYELLLAKELIDGALKRKGGFEQSKNNIEFGAMLKLSQIYADQMPHLIDVLADYLLWDRTVKEQEVSNIIGFLMALHKNRAALLALDYTSEQPLLAQVATVAPKLVTKFNEQALEILAQNA